MSLSSACVQVSGRLLVCLALFSASPAVLAQPVETPDNSLASQSPKHILLDQELELARLKQLDGKSTQATEPLTINRWRQAVFELRNSATVELGWPDMRQASQLARVKNAAEGSWNRVPLGLLHARYEREDEAHQLHVETVFALSPLLDRAYQGRSLELILESGSFLNYAIEAPVALFLDAGDGLGMRPLQLDETFAVSYQSTGTKTLTLQAQMRNGDVLTSKATLEVPQLVTPAPNDTWNIVATESYAGIAGTGSAYIYLADGHTQVTNPVLIVEGFDIDNSLGWPELYALLNRENLLEDLRAAGFDAVVLDFTEAVDPIQRNAFVLTRLLQQVNAATPLGQTSTIVGASMGGLVSRYALLWMEDQGISHDVRKLISFDSPQHGANIPLGMQAWVEFFAGQAEEADFLLQQLRKPASKQMLLYHLDGVSGTSANPDPLLAELNAEFDALGGWPVQPRLVSIINGSGQQAGQSFNPGDQLIEWNYDSALVDIDGNVWAVPDGGSKQIFNGRISIFFVINTTDSLTVSGTLPWDNAPGGSRPTMQQAADVNAPYGDIVALHQSHSFIPSVSALALDSNDPFYDVAGDAQLLDHTPFDTVYFPAANQEHIEITPENKQWFMAEVQAQIVVSMISGDTTEAGGTASFTVTPASAPANPVSIALSSSLPAEGSVPLEVILPAGSTVPQLVTVTGVDDGLLDGDIAYTIITASSVSDDPAYNGINPADVAVVNLDNEPKLELIFENGFEEP